MPAAERTLVSLPPHSECLVRGVSANDWNASICSPHFAQRYTYVGMDAPFDGRRGLALDAYECQSYRAADAASSGTSWVDSTLRSPPVAALSSPGWYRMSGHGCR